MGHVCHADGCQTPIPPRVFACRPHWYKLRKAMRDAIWREYRPGQERDKKPSLRYMAVQRRAIGEIAFKPNDEEAARIAAPYLLESEALRRLCIEQGLGDPLEGIVEV